MRKLFTIASLLSIIGIHAQQGPGLIISEILPNPTGTDSPFELVELVATRTINFSSTPYTIVAANNGTATTQGWVAGGGLSYGFQISTGTVNAGDVVYVGGSSMATTGTILRGINTGTTPGDGFGTANSGGVVGNGGTNADAIGVFNLPVASITNTSVPIDAVFYGSAIGTAVVNAGVDGYQMPVNDLYRGGKLQTTDFLAPDPGSAQYIVASGAFNPTTGAFTTARTFTLTTTFTDIATSITLGAVSSPSVSLSGTHVFVNESATSVNVTVNVAGPNNGQAVFTVGALPFSTASTSDYTPVTYTVAAGVSGAQTVSIPLLPDAIAEKDEYIALAFTSTYNCTASATAVYYIYLKDDDTPAPVATNQLFLDSLSTFQNGASGTNSAEIVAHDPTTQRLYIANSIGAKLDILNFSNPANPTLISSVNISSYGNINSVAVRNGVVAMAIENSANPQDSGKIVFLNSAGVFISQVKVGAMPDMITFNRAGTKVVTACEGEPNATYTNDPDGSVCVVDISGGVATVTQANVAFITFTAFNGQEAALRAMGIRIYGVSGIASKDFEPEYVTFTNNDSVAWVTLQENNCFAKINMITNTVTQLIPLGYKNWMTAGGMDASDQTTGIALMNAPVYGMYQPDAISSFYVNNQPYLITANEGDSRAYSGLNEEARISSMSLDATAFPYATQMKQNTFLGRLNATNKLGDTDNDGDFDQLYVYGARSFSIWNGSTGSQVYDSGDQLERVTSTHPVYAPLFNMSNGTGAGTLKNRSDDKGPEPEGTAVASINGDMFAFVALERIGGVITFNITNPAAPTYTGYYNHRTPAGGPDRGAEGLIYIPDSLSPNGNAIVIAANEVSSTLAIFQVTTCAQKANVTVTPSSYDGCSGGNITLTASVQPGTTYQWMQNGSTIVGATSNTYNATTTGDYQVMITNSTYACSGKTDFVPVIFHAAPTVTASATAGTICDGSSTTLNTSGAVTYNWMPGSMSGASVNVSPTSNTTYTVTGTSSFGCTNTQTVAVVVNSLPSIGASATQTSICTGNTTSLIGTGAGSGTYSWMPGSLSGSSPVVSPTSTTTYTVTGTDANGCTNTSTVAITVNATPTITATSSAPSICTGSSATLTGGGAATFSWMPGSLSGSSVAVSPTSNTTYTVTGTGAAGCTSTQTVSIAVNSLPTVTSSATLSSICNGSSTSLTGSGASTFSWMPGSLSGTTVSVSPASSTTYTVTGTDVNGCTNTSTVAITVLTRPTVTASAPITQVCNGSTTTLNGGGASTYNWMPINQNGSSVPVTITATTAYTVTGTASNGCTNTATINITMLPTPTVTASSNTTTVCSGNSVNLMSTGVNATNYIWFPGMMTGQNVTVIPNTTTTYTVNGYASNGCSHSSTVAITVNPSPTLTVGGATSICEGSSSTLTVAGATSYSWMPGSLSGNSQTLSPASTTTYTIIGTGANSCLDSVNVTLTVNTNPVAALSVSSDSVCNIDAVVNLNGTPLGGTYYGANVTGNSFDPNTAPIGTTPISYVYVDGNGCTDTANDSITVDVCLGTPDALVSDVNAYPNPFTDQMTLTSNSVIEKVEVYNTSGQLLFAEKTNASMVELNMSAYECGVYFIRVTGAEGSKMVTAVKL